MYDYLINSRSLQTVYPIQQELALEPTSNYLFDLSYLGVLNVAGDLAQEFLQGQLTCDLRLVNDIQMIQGAQCNLKGRILALLDVFNWHGIKLLIAKDLLEQTQNSLAKTALLSRVVLTSNDQVQVFGFYLQNQQDLLPPIRFFPEQLYGLSQSQDFCYYHLGHGFYIFIVDKQSVNEFTAPFAVQKRLLGSLTWHTLRLRTKEVSIYPESRGLFLPHRLDLHTTSYLSFDKGCYKGQEIIARTHYRATLKHELKLFEVHTEARLYSGQKIVAEQGQVEIGEIIDYSYLGEHHHLIAVSILKEVPSQLCVEQNDGRFITIELA